MKVYTCNLRVLFCFKNYYQSFNRPNLHSHSVLNENFPLEFNGWSKWWCSPDGCYERFKNIPDELGHVKLGPPVAAHLQNSARTAARNPKQLGNLWQNRSGLPARGTANLRCKFPILTTFSLLYMEKVIDFR